jgi:hypothetical protein
MATPSILTLIEKGRACTIKKEALDLREYRKELKQKQRLCKTLVGVVHILERKEAETRIQELSTKILAIESGSVRREFERDAIRLKRKASSTNDEDLAEVSLSRAETNSMDKNARRRTTARNIKVRATNKVTNLNNAESNMAADEFSNKWTEKEVTLYIEVKSEKCSVCQHGVIVTGMNNDMFCNICGSVVSSLAESHQGKVGEETDYINGCPGYRRIQHFIEWLSNFQGRETINYTKEHEKKILAVLVDDFQVRSTKDVTFDLVRQALKKLSKQKGNKNMVKFYDHCVLISCMIKEEPCPSLSHREEDKLRRMFCAVNCQFEHLQQQNPAFLHRKNFLPYSYILHKFMILRGLDHFTQYFPLLKSQTKLAAIDIIWERICNSMIPPWNFTPSI